MNAEVDDPGVYHQDFTTASGWEEFVDRVEKTIIDWKLNQTRIRNPIQKGDLGGAWVEKSEEIRFEGEKLYLSWWSLEDGVVVANEDTENTSASLPQSFTDMMSIAGDFVTVPTCPRVAQLFGIREFLLLHSDKKALVSSETKAKILLGSLTMAVNATGCEIPAFVQLLENWQHFYLGSCVGKDVSADYEMVHLERTPQHCKYLTGLLDTFKSKISRQQLPSINIAVRLTYSLRRLGQWFSVTELKDHDGSSSLMNLPFGMISDPISKLQLFATWPQLTDQMVVDSQSYSDLEPMQAHAWSVRIQLELNQDSLRLAQCLESLCKLASESPIPFIADFKKPKYGQSLDALTESKVPTISKVFDKVISANSANAGTHKKRQGVIPDSTLQEYLYFLFPDADRNSPQYASYENSTSPGSAENAILQGVKSAPAESLVWRLALLFPMVFCKDGTAAAAHLWHEFTEEMRYRWEQAIPVPGVQPGFADHKTCLLHQKLQMLNVCIKRKKELRTTATLKAGAPSRGSASPRGPSSDSEGDDEFLDAQSDDDFADVDMDVDGAGEDAADGGKAAAEAGAASAEVKHSLWNMPEGRKCKHKTLRLLQTGEPLYLPVTQELVPKTEDELENPEDRTDPTSPAAAGSESHLAQAHKYSCSVTLSDMESFKAANPSGTLEDFVRWYSPRDWIEDADGALDQWGQPAGRLSARMLLQENTWVELWAVAQPVPAARQRRLFDETRSAESVLSWLEALPARALALALLPALADACAARVLLEVQNGVLESDWARGGGGGVGHVQRRVPDGAPFPRLPTLATAQRLVRQAVNATREPAQSLKTYQRLVSEVADLEHQICTARSLSSKLCPDLAAADRQAPPTAEDKEMVDFLDALLGLGEVPVPGGPRGRIGKNIQSMFSDVQAMAYSHPQGAAAAAAGASGAAEPRGGSPEAAAFPPADVKEVVMRVVSPRPGPASRPCPQRMYAMHRKDEFRLAGCFTRDVTFF